MPGVSATAFWSVVELRPVAGAPFGVSTASRNGPLEPGPNASAELVVGDALRAATRPGCRRRAGRGAAASPAPRRRAAAHAGGDRHPRPAGHDLAPAGEGGRRPDVLGLLRHQPAAERADHDRQDRQRRHDHRADRDRRAEARSCRCTGSPITSRPAIATITISPAATTVLPAVAAALRRRVAAAVARGHLLAVAADDQQRVVDARRRGRASTRSPPRTRAGRAARRARPAGSGRPRRRPARRSASRPSRPRSGTAG